MKHLGQGDLAEQRFQLAYQQLRNWGLEEMAEKVKKTWERNDE